MLELFGSSSVDALEEKVPSSIFALADDDDFDDEGFDDEDDLDDDDDDDDDDRMANRISSFEIYPNPNAGEFAIQVSSSADANAEISIVDMIGKTQFIFTQVLDQGINTINVNASHLSKGIYFMKISIPGMPVEMKQVVIQN